MTHAVSYVKHLWSCLCVRDDVCAEEIELKAANWQAMLRRVGYRNVYRRERIPNDLVIRVRRHVRVCVRHVVLSLSLFYVRAFRNSAFRAPLLLLLPHLVSSREKRREEKRRWVLGVRDTRDWRKASRDNCVTRVIANRPTTNTVAAWTESLLGSRLEGG